MKLLAVTVAIATASTAPAYAQSGVDTAKFSKAYQNCVYYGEMHNSVAIPESECNSQELAAQDARLNQAYKMVIGRLSTPRKIDLRTDERNWIAARDRKCGRLDDDDRGECLIDETMKRVAYLERYR